MRQQKHNKGAFILSQETCQLGAKCIQHLTLYNIWVIEERLKAMNQWNSITYGRKKPSILTTEVQVKLTWHIRESLKVIPKHLLK